MPADSFHLGGEGQRAFYRAQVFLLRGTSAAARPELALALRKVDEAIRMLPANRWLRVVYRPPMLLQLGRRAEAIRTVDAALAEQGTDPDLGMLAAYDYAEVPAGRGCVDRREATPIRGGAMKHRRQESRSSWRRLP